MALRSPQGQWQWINWEMGSFPKEMVPNFPNSRRNLKDYPGGTNSWWGGYPGGIVDKKHSENQEKKVNISSCKSGAGKALEMGAKSGIWGDGEEETPGRQNPMWLWQGEIEHWEEKETLERKKHWGKHYLECKDLPQTLPRSPAWLYPWSLPVCWAPSPGSRSRQRWSWWCSGAETNPKQLRVSKTTMGRQDKHKSLKIRRF